MLNLNYTHAFLYFRFLSRRHTMQNIPSTIRHNYSKLYRIGIVLLTIGLMVFISPKSAKFQYEFDQGFPWVHQPLYAPFSFAINKTPDQIKLEKKEIKDASYLYFEIAPNMADSITEEFTASVTLLFDADSATTKTQETAFLQHGTALIKRLYAIGIIANEDSLLNKPNDYVIKTIGNHVEKQYQIDAFLTLNQAFDSVSVWAKNLNYSKQLTISILEKIRPNITYNPQLTAQILNQKMALLPTVYGKINEGEKIIAKGEIVTAETYQKLRSLQENYEKQAGNDRSKWYLYGGTFIFVGFATLLLILTLRMYSVTVYAETNAFTLILLLFLMSYLMINIPRYFPEVESYILPFVLFAVILQSFFSSALASIIYMIMMIMAGLIAPNGIEFIWIQVPAGLLAILLLNNLRKRSQLLGVVAMVFVTSSLLYFASSIIKEGHLSNIEIAKFGWFAASALLTVLAIPLVYIIERLFGLVSEMALLELSDTNNKLLRQLAQTAPGTFQHSIQVANLAEECALEIGGDALLIRTAALYHDIGKLENPSYFIENQSGGHNPHNELSEIESAQIIINHVIHGIELAKKHKLPEKIIDFIRTHHGTTTTRYFLYHAQQKDANVNPKDYMYPGPLPFSKETAILMLCDGVEAASRSLPEYSAESISKLIDGIFETILSSNQLEYAPITFQNITSLKKLLKKKIMNIYHVRVAYPAG